MSWLNEELPTDWPTKPPVPAPNRSEPDFSTSRSSGEADDSIEIRPTVAIQADGTAKTPPWKHAIGAPVDRPSLDRPRLTRLFMPPEDLLPESSPGGSPRVEKRASQAQLQTPRDDLRKPSLTSNEVPGDQSILQLRHDAHSGAGADEAVDGKNSNARVGEHLHEHLHEQHPGEHLSSEFSSSQSTSSLMHSDSQEEPPQPINRRLKVFGRPDTYTSERLGDLLSSMGGGGGNNDDNDDDDEELSINTFRHQTTLNTRHNTKTSTNTKNDSIYESDANLADDLQNEGRKVLQGLAPFRPSTWQHEESSLDELEQQLTSQSTKGVPVTTNIDDTTSSNLFTDHRDPAGAAGSPLSSTSSSPTSHTLDTLPPRLRHWSSIKRNLGASPAPGHLSKRDSTQTLLNSAKQPPTEADISALGINAGFSTPSREGGAGTVPEISEPSGNLKLGEVTLDTSASGLSNFTASTTSEPALARHAAELNGTRQSVAGSVGIFTSSSANSNETRNESRESHNSIYPRDHPALQSVSSRMPSTSESWRSGASFADRTPESIVQKYLTFPKRAQRAVHTPTARFSTVPASHTYRASSSINTNNDSGPETAAAPATAPARSTVTGAVEIPMQQTSRGRADVNDSDDVDCSVAYRDLSFSAGYEMLAHLIRERIPEDSRDTRIENLDSLDLSQCELESIEGLSRFTPHLTTLFLNDNSIRSLGGLPFSLVHLDLSSNVLSNMNRFPRSLVSTLLLSNNRLTSLEPLEGLRALSSLDLSNNQLTSLKGISALTALRTLNVRQNRLKSIDLNLGMLVDLDAAQNNIVSVRLNTPNLETLDLSGNNVPTLTDALPNLRELNMQYNNATLDFHGFQSLKVLLFDGNVAVQHFEEIAGILETFSWEQPRNAPGHTLDVRLLESVRDIKLGGGQPRGWPLGGGPVVFAVQHLDLSALGIKALPLEFPRMFPFVKSLNFSFNKLDDTVIPVLAQCHLLERLSLFGNRLTTSGAALASRLPQLRVLDSRSQRPGRSFVSSGEYPTDKYSAIVESALESAGSAQPAASSASTMSSSSSAAAAAAAPLNCKYLQLLDAKWTNHALKTTITTRPGFVSPLYPVEGVTPPVSSSTDLSGVNETTVLDPINAIDLLEAMYVHHFYASGQARGLN